jgi:hypothetical protein
LPPCLQDEAAIYAVQINCVSRPDAIRALRANGGDPDASLLWLLAERQEEEAKAGPDPAAVAELRANGLAQEDVLAALSHCKGNVAAVSVCLLMSRITRVAGCMLPAAKPGLLCYRCLLPSLPSTWHLQALAFAVECMDCGGQAAVLAERIGSGMASEAAEPGAGGAAALGGRAAEEAAAREREARRKAELAEVQAVLAAFEANAGLQRSRVVRIERVQHLDLYSQYLRCVGGWAGGRRQGLLLCALLAVQAVSSATTSVRFCCSVNGANANCMCAVCCRRRARIALEAAQHPGGGANEQRLFQGADQVCCRLLLDTCPG